VTPQAAAGWPDLGRLGLGCAPLGNLYRATSDEAAQATVDAAWEAGIRLFDTAPLYGHGVSERRTGAALRTRPRHEYVLATKVGRLLVPDAPGTAAAPTIFEDLPPVHPVFDYSRDGVLRSVEESLERLGTDRIDLLHVHDPDDHIDEALDGAYPAIVQLRDEGVVAAIGLGTNWAHVAERFVGRADLDWLLLAGRHTLLEQTGTAALLARCEEHSVRVLAAGVLNSGILADPSPGARYDYGPATAEQLARAQEMAEVCAAHGVPLAAAAVQFPLRHPAVSMVLVGAASAAEVAEDAALLGHPIPDACWADLAELGVPLDGGSAAAG
jgi:D-threo-aldose 1-dehydrogenase